MQEIELKLITQNVRFGSKAEMCSAKRHVRFAPKADMSSAARDVRFVPIADIQNSCSTENPRESGG
ncbi:MAG: hypothetical protein WA625_23700, partial [Pseudolabrys sp.]